MSGTITELGEVSVGACIPTALGAFGALEGNLNGQLAAAGNLKLALNVGPPSIAVAGEIGAEVTAQVMASVTLPYFGIAIDANLEVIASIQAQLSALVGIIASLGAAGVYLYRYDGTADSFGSALGSVVGSGLPGGAGTDDVHALTLIASTPAAWAAIGAIFKTT
jgi:hypothetical protein